MKAEIEVFLSRAEYEALFGLRVSNEISSVCLYIGTCLVKEYIFWDAQDEIDLLEAWAE